MYELEKFLHEHPSDYEELLSKAPYYITIKHDDDFVSFHYSLFESDMSNPIVRECRGSIFHATTLNCVCMPFYIFRNYEEEIADTIDWSTARVQEKVDGSLIKFWYYGSAWHISTNGTIDARKAPANDTESFYDIVHEAVDVEELCAYLSTECTYMFELVSPKIDHVCTYSDTCLYILGARELKSGKEFSDWDIAPWLVREPHSYSLSSLNEIVASLDFLSDNEEGYVVVDADWHRIKVKSPIYLAKHYARANGQLSIKKILQMWRNQELDDFYIYAPKGHKDKVDSVLNRIRALESYLDAYECPYATPKELALNMKPSVEREFMFKKMRDPCYSAKTFLDLISLSYLREILMGE